MTLKRSFAWTVLFFKGPLARSLHGCAIVLTLASLAAIPASADAATSGSGTLTITVNTGQSITVTVTPATLTFSESVTSPGSGWTFASTNPSWMPGAWTPGAYYYGATGSGNCLSIAVNTSVSGWGLTGYYTVSGGLTSSNTNVSLGTSGSSCAAPTSGTATLSTNSASPTTLQSSQNGSQTFYYYVAVQPTTAITSAATITVTFTAQ